MIRLFSTVICRKIGRPYSTAKGTLHGCIKEDAILSKVKVCSTAIIDYNQYATMPGSAVVPCMEYSGIAGAGVRGN